MHSCVLIKGLTNVLGQHVANCPTGIELTASRTYFKLLFLGVGVGGGAACCNHIPGGEMIAQGIFVNQVTEFLFCFLGQHVAHHSSSGEPVDSGHSHGTHHLPADDRHRRLQPHCGGDPGKEEEVRDDD